MPIDVLPDDVLLEIFDFWVDQVLPTRRKEIEAWQTLVHVCRRWRSVVFGSPRRLNLQLLCTVKTPTRDTLDIWPASMPLFVRCNRDYPIESLDNIIFALERSDRVCRIELMHVPSSDLKLLLAAMLAIQEPFPELTRLELSSGDKTMPVLPDSFLGGSAPRLQQLTLYGIPFPGLPKLLLSATHLVALHLHEIPHSGFFSPEEIVTTLSVLTGLESLSIGFKYPRSRPDRASRRPPPPTRRLLPALTSFWFKGACEYLDDLVACVDAPLSSLYIIFFEQNVFDTPQLVQFISRSPMWKARIKAHVLLGNSFIDVQLSSRTISGSRKHRVAIVFREPRELYWQLLSLKQVCTSLLPPLSTLEDLYIYAFDEEDSSYGDNIEKPLWLELLPHFAAVKNLYISEEFEPHIMPALQELIGGKTMEVFPDLQNIFLEGLQPSGPVQEGIGQFVAARQVSHPITASHWYKDDSEDI